MPAEGPEARDVRALSAGGWPVEFRTPVGRELKLIRDHAQTLKDRLIEIGLRAERAQFLERL